MSEIVNQGSVNFLFNYSDVVITVKGKETLFQFNVVVDPVSLIQFN